MTNFKKRISKIGAGLMASLCAVSMAGGTVGGIYAGATDNPFTENEAFPSADVIVAEAATLLGSPYGFGNKGYTGAYYQDSYQALPLDTVREQGVDCSGLLYYTLTHLGYSTTGFSWNNPVPVDTMHWITASDNCTITYNGITSKIDVEKAYVDTQELPYWECEDGSTIAPGSMVIAENPYAEDHSWIYIGEFDSRDEVVNYLLNIGVEPSYINSYTVGDGSGDGGTHWRIESNGAEGVVINNRTDGKYATSMKMYAFRVAKEEEKSGTIRINKSAENGVISDREFVVSWTENGTEHSENVTTNANGIAELSDLHVYEAGTKTAISYNISEINPDTRYETPKAVDITLENGNADLVVAVDFENVLKKGSLRINVI